MRSKRSKAWHRRKDEKLRARRLIERGIDTPPYFPGIVNAAGLQIRKALAQIRLSVLNGNIILRPVLRDPGKPLKFRRYDPSKSD